LVVWLWEWETKLVFDEMGDKVSSRL
jgi:hypothetical protein